MTMMNTMNLFNLAAQEEDIVKDIAMSTLAAFN